MNLDDFYEETPKQEIQIVENQLILAKNLQNKIVEFEKQKKAIEDAEKILKEQLEQVMGENGIFSYETNDKKIKISYTPSTITQIFDSKQLYEEQPDIYRKYLKDASRKASVRITVREKENEI